LALNPKEYPDVYCYLFVPPSLEGKIPKGRYTLPLSPGEERLLNLSIPQGPPVIFMPWQRGRVAYKRTTPDLSKFVCFRGLIPPPKIRRSRTSPKVMKYEKPALYRYTLILPGKSV